MSENTHRSSSAYDPQQPYGSGGSSGSYPPPPPYVPHEPAEPQQPVITPSAVTMWPGTDAGPGAGTEAGGGNGWNGVAEAPAEPRRRARRPVALLAAVAIVSGLIGGGTAALVGHATSTQAAAMTTTRVVNASSSSSSGVAAVAAAVNPSVVQITATSSSEEATGAGVILTSDGQIVTNNHVIAGASSIKVSFSNGKTATATVVGTDPTKDLALIKAQSVSGLTAASLGDSSNVAVGDQVVAIGSPEGLTDTVTSGIISALNRDVTVPVEDGSSSSPQQGQDQGGQGQGYGGMGGGGMGGGMGGGGQWPFSFGGQQYNGSTGSSTTTYKAMQTDAALNPGNSGGALINMSGQIIGISSAMYSASSSDSGSDSSSAGSIGLGFAIPINTVKDDLSTLRSGGTSS